MIGNINTPLNWFTFHFNKFLSGYKRAIYKTIIAWLKIAKTAINKVLQKGLVAAILCDISPIKKQKAKPKSKAKSGKNQ